MVGQHTVNGVDYITCRECRAHKPRYHKKQGNICRECWLPIAQEKARKHRAKNPGRERQAQKKYYEKNRERKRAFVRRYRYARRRRDPVFAAEMNIRTAVSNVVKNGGGKKWGKTAEIIGRKPADVAAQVVAMGYCKGMHIDHIIPFPVLRARYPGDERRVQREAWKACNLRVIPAAENYRKNALREFLV